MTAQGQGRVVTPVSKTKAQQGALGTQPAARGECHLVPTSDVYKKYLEAEIDCCLDKDSLTQI